MYVNVHCGSISRVSSRSVWIMQRSKQSLGSHMDRKSKYYSQGIWRPLFGWVITWTPETLQFSVQEG